MALNRLKQKMVLTLSDEVLEQVSRRGIEEGEKGCKQS